VQFARPAECYLLVWVADDAVEEDADPLSDAGHDQPGHGVLRLRAEAYGPTGARRAIEAELARQCLPGTPAGHGCRQGIRVQSWHELREAVP
jgi:hypothetical protein